MTLRWPSWLTFDHFFTVASFLLAAFALWVSTRAKRKASEVERAATQTADVFIELDDRAPRAPTAELIGNITFENRGTASASIVSVRFQPGPKETDWLDALFPLEIAGHRELEFDMPFKTFSEARQEAEITWKDPLGRHTKTLTVVARQ